MSFTTLAITGVVKDASQTAIAGAVVNLQLNTAITDLVTEIPATIITDTADGSGNISYASIVANDDTTTSPQNSFYTVTIFNGDEIIDYFGVVIPHASAPTVNLFSLSRVNAATLPPINYGVASFNTRKGPVALTKADVTGVGGLANTNNLGDVSDAGSSRLNLHVAELAVCQAVATSSVTLSGLQTIDGYVMQTNDLVLCAAQTTPAQNGPWIVGSGSWTRPHEYAAGSSVVAGRVLSVANGTTYGATRWLLTTPGTVTVDTTATTWIQNSAGANSLIFDSFAGYSNGQAPVTSLSGHTYNVTGASSAACLAESGLLTLSPVTSSMTWYAQLFTGTYNTPANPITRIGSIITLTAGTTESAAYGMNLWNGKTIPGYSCCHLTVLADHWTYGVWINGSFTIIYQKNFDNPLPFGVPLTFECVIDQPNGRAFVREPDGSIFPVADPLIRQGLPGMYATWEETTVLSTDWVAGISQLWADIAPRPAAKAPQAEIIAATVAIGRGA